MTDPSTLFRQEALAFQADRLPTGAPLQLGSWTRWFYWAVLVLVGGGLVLGFTLRASRTASGPAVVDLHRGTFAAVLPDASAAAAQPGRLVHITVPRTFRDAHQGRITAAAAADPAGLRRAGLDTQVASAQRNGGTLVSGSLLPRARPLSSQRPGRSSNQPVSGRVVIVLSSGRLLTVVFDGFSLS